MTYPQLERLCVDCGGEPLPGEIVYFPQRNVFLKIIKRYTRRHYSPWSTGAGFGGVYAVESAVTAQASWRWHFYGRFMQVVCAFRSAWRQWRKDCI